MWRLLADLKAQVRTLEDDLRERSGEVEGFAAALDAEWRAARDAKRTAATYGAWREDRVTQAAVAWVLATVFVRFCEDNGLIDLPYLAGPGERPAVAVERQQAFFEQHPEKTDRDWIVEGVDALGVAKVAAGLFNRRHNAMWTITPSHDAAKALLGFWRRHGEDGEIIHDFTDPQWGTRFLGDLYQDLSEHAKKTYALLQTPEFVEEFILDYTLEPAVDEFGLDGLRMIDPTCGSGHFLLGAFCRLLTKWEAQAPALDRWELITRALNSVHGVDKNPFAAAIARFRLLVAAMKAAGISRLTDAPAFPINVAIGDSLLHGRGGPGIQTELDLFDTEHETHTYVTEDIHDYEKLPVDMLGIGTYHVVVGNPPYMTPKDKVEAEAYRRAYPPCRGMFALTVPFIARFFKLARRSDDDRGGYVGLLSANSFTKRDFGRPIIEQFLPTVDITQVIDTSGAYIPGHGIPTIILFGRHQPPQNIRVKVIVADRGEPAVPHDPSRGHAWRSILGGIEHLTYADEWTHGFEIDRAVLSSFPWDLSDAPTKQILRQMATGMELRDRVIRIGYFANTGSDHVFTAPPESFRRIRAEIQPLIPVVTGSGVRDWTVVCDAYGVVFAGLSQGPLDKEISPHHFKRLWPYRTVLGNRPNYSRRSYFQDGRPWYQWHQITETAHSHPWMIVFPWVSTHNHFAVLRERIAPLHSAPVIRLPETAVDSDLLQLTALLNSSLVCFWLKQYSHTKGQPLMPSQAGGGEPWALFYEFTATRLRDLPLPPERWSKDRWSVHAERLDRLAQELMAAEPRSILSLTAPVTSAELDAAHARWDEARAGLISLQEELDWEIYGRYGIVNNVEELLAQNDDIPGIVVGERAFEIVLARRIIKGEVSSSWFQRHRAMPISEIPDHWPTRYRKVVQKRIELIERLQDIAVIERPEFKRRWATESWEEKERDAIRHWLLDRCENPALWYETGRHRELRPRPLPISGLASRLGEDEQFSMLVSRYAEPGADVTKVIAGIIQDEHIPYLAALRYKEPGIRKRAKWADVWRLQREEDTSDYTLEIPIPPVYTLADFLRPAYWRQRGKYDVPNERFISYPLVSLSGEILIGWAGWSHSERALVLIDLIENLKRLGNDTDDFIVPLLGGLYELLPWLQQWHRDPEPPFWKVAPAEQVEAYLDADQIERSILCRKILAWRPPKPKRGRPRKTLSSPETET